MDDNVSHWPASASTCCVSNAYASGDRSRSALNRSAKKICKRDKNRTKIELKNNWVDTYKLINVGKSIFKDGIIVFIVVVVAKFIVGSSRANLQSKTKDGKDGLTRY